MVIYRSVSLIKSFCGEVQGGQFFQKAPPLAAGGQYAADKVVRLSV